MMFPTLGGYAITKAPAIDLAEKMSPDSSALLKIVLVGNTKNIPDLIV